MPFLLFLDISLWLQSLKKVISRLFFLNPWTYVACRTNLKAAHLSLNGSATRGPNLKAYYAYATLSLHKYQWSIFAWHVCNVVSTTEYTQSGNGRFLAYIPSWLKNQPWLEGARPSPLHSIYHHVQSCSVRSSWEGNYTPPISSLPTPICTLWRVPLKMILYFTGWPIGPSSLYKVSQLQAANVDSLRPRYTQSRHSTKLFSPEPKAKGTHSPAGEGVGGSQFGRGYRHCGTRDI
jgi:hypothetical protein